MGKKMIYLEGAKAFVNPIQVASIYKEGDKYNVGLAGGKVYAMSDAEAFNLMSACNEGHSMPPQVPMPPKQEDDKQYPEWLTKLMDEYGQQK